MKVNFSQVIVDKRDKKPFPFVAVIKNEYVLDKNGNPVLDSQGQKINALDTRDMTLKDAVQTALTFIYPDEKNEPETKRKRARLVEKIYDAESDEIEIDIKEATTILECVEKYYGGLVILAVERMLENKA